MLLTEGVSAAMTQGIAGILLVGLASRHRRLVSSGSASITVTSSKGVSTAITQGIAGILFFCTLF
jgi:hypothetical protein